MQNNNPNYILLALGVYAAIIIYFVIRGARKNKNIKDYAIGSMGFSPWVVGLSLAASMTSAATFIINPGFIGLYGLSGILSFGIVFPLAAFISLILLTKGFLKYGSATKATTMAQWMGNKYNSTSYALFFGVASLLLITFIVLINVGITQVISKSTGIPPLYILISITVFVFGYMMFGGANSMVYTNTIQAIIMLIVAIILIGSGYEYFENGVENFLNDLSAIDPNLTKSTNESSFLFRDYFEIIVAQFIIGIAVVCQPHIITKSLLLKDKKKVNVFLSSAILFMVFFFSIVVVGLYTRLSFPDLTFNGESLKMDELVPTYVAVKFTAGVTIIIVVGLISAGLSTLESLIQSLSITITSDIIQPITKNTMKNTIILNRIVIVGLAVISFIFSWQQITNPDVSVAIFAQNGVYAYFSAAFVPVIFGTFLKNVQLSTVFTASILALVIHFGIYYGRLTPYMQEPVNNPGIPAAIAITASMVVGLLLHNFNRKKIA